MAYGGSNCNKNVDGWSPVLSDLNPDDLKTLKSFLRQSDESDHSLASSLQAVDIPAFEGGENMESEKTPCKSYQFSQEFSPVLGKICLL